MRRLLGIILGVLALWLGTPPSFAAASPPGQPELLQAYTYDVSGAHASVDTASERGPPSTYDRDSTEDGGDSWPNGASVRSNATKTGSPTTHATCVEFVQVARATTMTGAQVGASDGDFCRISGPSPPQTAHDPRSRALRLSRAGSRVPQSRMTFWSDVALTAV